MFDFTNIVSGKSYISAQGLTPPYITNYITSYRLPTEVMSGDKFGDWVAPFNFINTDDKIAFRLFGLYHSSNGLCTPGIIHSPKNMNLIDVLTNQPNSLVVNFNSDKPILSGDYVVIKGARKQVLRSEMKIDMLYKAKMLTKPTFKCKLYLVNRLVFNDATADDYKLLVALDNFVENIDKEIVNYVDNFFYTALPLCTAGGQPIIVAPGSAVYENGKSTFKANLKVLVDKFKDNLWKQL